MSKQKSDSSVSTAKHYTYREWRELLGLPWPPSGCSIEDAEGTEVTLYPDGAAAYTDGGVSVPVREEEVRAARPAEGGDRVSTPRPSWLVVKLIGGDRHVSTLAEAGAAVRDEIENALGWIGSGEWSRKTKRGGIPVLDAAGQTVATVSYNGRVWDMDGKEVV